MANGFEHLELEERAQLFEAQTRVLEAGALGEDLQTVLSLLCRQVRSLMEQCKYCTVLLVRDGRIYHGASPGVPQSFVDAVDGLAIGPSVGSCGTAAYRGEPVITPDIEIDPLWEDWRELARKFDLVACWSTPVFDADDNVVATFAVYPNVKKEPSPKDRALLDAFAHVAGLTLVRHRAEEELAGEKRRLSAVVRGTNAGAWEWDPRDDTATVTEDWARILGYTREELEPISLERVRELAHPDDISDAADAIEAHLRGETDFFECEFRLRHKNGDWIWVLDRGRVTERDENGDPTRVSGMHMDITDRKRREQSARAAQQDLALTLDSLAEAVVTTDSDRRIRRINRVAADFIGRPAEEVEGKSIFAVLPFLEALEDAPPVHAHEEDGPVSLLNNETFTVPDADGNEVIVLCSVNCIGVEPGSAERLVVTFRDITDKHRIQSELRKSRAVLDRAGQLARVGGWDFDVRTNTMWVSERARDIYDLPKGVEPDLERGLSRIRDDQQRERLTKIFQEASQQRRRIQEEFPIETLEGNQKWVVMTGEPVIEEGECIRLEGAIQDVSTRREAEEALHRMRKLESLGRLAGGIAHDFNNLLMGFFANVTFAREQLDEEHPARRDLEEAESALESAKNLTNQLLTFSKGGAPVKETVSIADIVEQTVRFDLSGSRIKPDFDIARGLWRTDADQGQIQQVVSQLTVNAREAMNEAGQIFITLENTEISHDTELPLEPGRFVRLAVRDEGPGISEDRQERIFEPYYTGKAAGRGLGLATVYSIVHQHGGYVDVTSSPGDGAEFVVYLPASESAESTEVSEVTVSTGTSSPSTMAPRHVLVMDDDAAVRRACQRMLERMGHTVTCAVDGREALEIYRDAATSDTPVDLVIMDITIPGGMGGKKAVEELLSFDPDARAVVSTGYADDPVLAHYEDYGFVGIAPKPYTPDQLRSVLYDALTD